MEKFQCSEEILGTSNLSVNVSAESKKIGKQSQEKALYPFEVMYEGLERSWVSLEDKKPLGVIFENHLVTFRVSPTRMNWHEAMAYCQSIKIGGNACSAGKIKFWEKLVWNEKGELFDDLYKQLSAESLKDKVFWSSSECDSPNNLAWMWMYVHDDWGYGDKDFTFGLYVCPVLDLSKLSL